MPLALPSLEDLGNESDEDQLPVLRKLSDMIRSPSQLSVNEESPTASCTTSTFHVPGIQPKQAGLSQTFQKLSHFSSSRSFVSRIVPGDQQIGVTTTAFLERQKTAGTCYEELKTALDESVSSSTSSCDAQGSAVCSVPSTPSLETSVESLHLSSSSSASGPQNCSGWLSSSFFSCVGSTSDISVEGTPRPSTLPEAQQLPASFSNPASPMEDIIASGDGATLQAPRDLDVPTERQCYKAQIKAINAKDIHNICSGQVILSLASACKELIENSLDAGASNIEVRLKEYGLDSLEVTDDGTGIEECNYQALVLKHHTSKIQQFDDLSGLETFGFRGEALSSLCATSNVVVTTRTKEQSIGTRLTYDHNQRLVSQMPVPHNIGTTVSLTKMFANFPVRHREFAKGIKKEFSQLVHILQQYAVSQPHLRFLCINHTKSGKTTILNTKKDSSMMENICCVFGSKVVKMVVPFQASCNDAGFLFDGYVSKPETGCGRGSNDMQFFFVNKRPVDLPKLSKAINQLFRRYNTGCQYPIFFVNIDTKSNQYDINVTPDKRKVFLHDEDAMLDFLQQQLLVLWEPSRYTYTATQSLQEALPLGTSSRSVRQLSMTSHTSSLSELQHTQRCDTEISEDVMDKNGSANCDTDPEELVPNPDPGEVKSPVHPSAMPTIEHSPQGQQTSMRRPSSQSELLTCQADIGLAEDDGKLSLGLEDRPAMDTLRTSPAHSEGRPLSSPTVGRFVSRRTGRCIPLPADSDLSVRSSTLPNEKLPGTKRSSGSRFLETECKCKDDAGSETDGTVEEEDIQFICDDNVVDDEGMHLRVLNSQRRKAHLSKRKRSQANGPSELEDTAPTMDDSLLRSEPTVELFDLDRIDSDIEVALDNMLESQDHHVNAACSVAVDVQALRQYLASSGRMQNAASIASLKGADSGQAQSESNFQCHMNNHSNVECEQELTRRIEKHHFNEMEVIGQFNEGFIITTLHNDLFIIDQHAADEKYNFEELHRTTVISSQPLLIAKASGLGAADEVIIEENLDIFQANGFHFINNERAKATADASQAPQSRLLIASLPVSKQVMFTEHDIQEMICLLRERPGVMCRPSKVSAMLASRACRKSVMVGRPLDHRQMTTIVRHLSSMDQPWNCPHGRPTMRHLVTLPRNGLHSASPQQPCLGRLLSSDGGPPAKRVFTQRQSSFG